jgi:hypothetical protein
MATTFGQVVGAPVTASIVVANRPGVLHGILLSSVAATATIQLYDSAVLADLTSPITGLITPGAVTVPNFISIPIVTNRGLVIIIAVAAVNLTVIGRY